MRSIIGTVIKLRDFFSRNTYTLTANKDLCAGRAYFIPYYQREIRWELKNVDNLIADIKSNREKFLGNIILSKRNDADINYEIIDGQQRTTIILMIVHYLMNRPTGALNFTPVDFKINSFNKYNLLVCANFDEDSIPAAERQEFELSDDYSQRGRYIEIYLEISRILDGYSDSDRTAFSENLLNAEINLIVSTGDHDAGMEYFLDVNLKAVKLEAEDIFKGYFFKIMGQVNRIDEAKREWEGLKKAYNKLGNSADISLVTLLHHYILCTINSQADYSNVRIDTELNIYDNNSEASKDVPIGDKIFHKGDNILSTFGAYNYPLSVVVGLKDYITKILTKVINGSCDTSFKELFNCVTERGGVDDTTKQLSFACMQAISKGSFTVPKALVMKYGIELLSGSMTSRSECKKVFSAYFLGTVFSVLENKAKELIKIESILRASTDSWHKHAVRKGSSYFDNAEFADKKAYKRYMIRHAEDDERYLASSLALIYNYFTIEDELISVNEAGALRFITTNSSEFSVEHFLVNESNVKLGSVRTNSKYPSHVKRIRNSLFNFIFIPETMNRDDLKNYDPAKKLEIIIPRINEIRCEYSKKVLEIIQSEDVSFCFPNWSDITDKDFAQEQVDRYFSDSEETDTSNFFLPAYVRYAEAVLDAVKEKLTSEE